MFNPRTLILLAIALVLALVSVMVAQRWLALQQPPPAAAAPPAEETIAVVVAATRIEHLSKIRDSEVKIVNFPKSSLPFDPSLPSGGFNFFHDPTEVVGKIVTQTVYPGEPIVGERVRVNLGGSGLSHLIDVSRHMRAVSVRVNDVTGVAGFLVPSDRVDVVLVRKQPNSEEIITDVILDDVRVLAVDQETSPDRDKPFLARTVTLELTPLDASRVLRASEQGTLQIALRNPRDKTSLHALWASPATGMRQRSAGVRLTTTRTVGRGNLGDLRYQCTEGVCILENPGAAMVDSTAVAAPSLLGAAAGLPPGLPASPEQATNLPRE